MKKLLSALLSTVLCFACLMCLAACGGGNGGGKDPVEVADNTKYYDAVTKTLKLDKEYAGKSFLKDGIGSATVDAYTDGDTTRFKLAQGDIVIIRYYNIDTPESTGSVEKWGKAASAFTKKQLSSATEIVLEATRTPAEHDSYGTRYLGYVWYKTADYNEFKCLNLEIVENGFSENKGINTSDYPYYSYFKKANDFAQSIKLRLYSELEDPLYNTDPIEMTIKEFNENPDAFYNADSDSGAKVVFYAYLKSLTISSSGTYTFVAEEYDRETGKTYELDVYAMYSSSPASTMKVGHMYHIVGNVQNHYGHFQISGITYDSMYQKPHLTYVTQFNYYLMFNSGKAFETNYSATLYSDLTVTSASVDGTTLTVSGTAQKCAANGYGDATPFTVKVAVSAGYTCNFTAGDKLRFNGYQFVNNSGEITVKSINDIVKQ